MQVLQSTNVCICTTADTLYLQEKQASIVFGIFYATEPSLRLSLYCSTSFYLQISSLSSKVLHACRASADPSPLARAEHIVYLSAFFNAEAKAMEYFQQVSDSYLGKSQPAADASTAPTVA